MKGRGFNNVLNLEGGIMAWNGYEATGKPDAGLFLIDQMSSIDEYTALAWALENGARKFYKKASEITDGEASKLFSTLITAEDRHQKNILAAYKEISGDEIPQDKLDEIASKGYMEGGISLVEAFSFLETKKGSLSDILELSMQLEVNSLDLYYKLIEKIDNEGAAAIYVKILDEEKSHLERLGKLLETSCK